jgi:hypothetical protein
MYVKHALLFARRNINYKFKMLRKIFVSKAGEMRNLENYITTNLFTYADELNIVRMMSFRA